MPSQGGKIKTLSSRQKESMELLVKTLTSFVLDDSDHLEVEDHSIYDDSDKQGPPSAKTLNEERLHENVEEGSSIQIPPDVSTQRWLISACDDLIAESIRLEYSLRTLGAGGSGMYGAWVLRQGLGIFSDVLKSRSMEELSGIFDALVFSEYPFFLDQLSRPLSILWKAFDELESFLIDFVSFFYSVALKRVLESLKLSIRNQLWSLKALKSRTYFSPLEGRTILDDLVFFFSNLAKSFEIFCKELSNFRTQGVPLIRTSQQNQTERHLMLTTISTFFSAVTSATLQIALQGNTDAENPILVTATNTFFFSSLIFSTASAVQALLAMAWHRSFIRVPKRSYAFQWVSKGPLVSLVISGAFFAIGLCLFVIASQKKSVTTIITIAFALIHSAGLIMISIWFILEKWRFRRQSEAVGRKLTETSVTMSFLALIINFSLRASGIAKKCSRLMRAMLLHLYGNINKTKNNRDSDLEGKADPGLHGRVDSGMEEDDVDPGSPDEGVLEITIEPPSRAETISSLGEPDIEWDQFEADSRIRSLSEFEMPQSPDIRYDDNPIPTNEEQKPENEVLKKVRFSRVPVFTAKGSSSSNNKWLPEGEIHSSPHSYFDHVENEVEKTLNTGMAGTSAGVNRTRFAEQADAEFLQVRQDSWEHGLRQESISYMEMHNRRNPKKKRTYPPSELPPPF